MTSSNDSVPITRSRRSAGVIFRWPLLIGVATGYGLVSALVADGMWDWLASFGLVLPVALAGWFYCRPKISA